MNPTCKFCGDQIQESRDYRLVQGFERIRRDAGGTNALRLRSPSAEFACRWCIEKLASGVAAGQASLL